jgi:hypothetical protein
MNINDLAENLSPLKDLLNAKEPSLNNDLYPPGHFYSAVFSIEELKLRKEKIWKGTDNPHVSGIDMNAEGQLELVNSLSKYYDEMPFGRESEGLRYHFENDFYSYTDGIILYSMMRHFQPKKIIEVGSGHTSALMLDTKERFNMNTELMFIEPFPDRLYSLLRESDKRQCQVNVCPVQEADPSLFAALQPNDILFIDSSHVFKTGSDLHYLFFEVFPVLQTGVVLHFHDIFFPFEYPQKWIFEGRNWNENYFLRAFLTNNNAFKILVFAHFLHLHHRYIFKDMPLCYKNGGGNLWLQKMA